MYRYTAGLVKFTFRRPPCDCYDWDDEQNLMVKVPVSKTMNLIRKYRLVTVSGDLKYPPSSQRKI
jgi:hypothetical protein